MKKKVVAFITALLFCVSAGTAVMYGSGLTENSMSTTSISASAKDNPNICADYANAPLFDDTKVHTVNVIISDEEWAKISSATSEEKEYATCDVEIDGELFENVAIKAKGHASLNFARAKQGEQSEKVGLRINFGKNDGLTTYHGLDKLSLNNLAADKTCAKDFMTYHMMKDMGVYAPLCSYTVVKVNGQDFMLSLAVEDLDKSFVYRNYGADAEVDIYEPESAQASNTSDFGAVLQVFSGNAYAGLDKSDRVEPWMVISDKMFVEDMLDTNCCRWIDDNPDSYNNIFDNDELKCSDEDKVKMIESLNKLNNGTQEEALSVLDTDQLMRFFVVHGFVNNYDSITGKNRHNCIITENNGVLSYIPWDYNEALGGFDSRVVIRDVMGNLDLDMEPTGLDNVMSAETDLINMPIDNPNRVGGTEQLPMLDKWISNDEYKAKYHELCREFTGYEAQYSELTTSIREQVAPYVAKGLTFYTTEEFNDAMDNMDLYLKYRFESYNKQLDGEIPATWEGQKAEYETLVDPEGLELYKMASATGLIGCPPAQVLNPIINAYQGKDPDRSCEHFAQKILAYFKDPLTMLDQVPVLMQVPACRQDAMNIVHTKYGTPSMFKVQGGPPAGVPGGAGVPEGTEGTGVTDETEGATEATEVTEATGVTEKESSAVETELPTEEQVKATDVTEVTSEVSTTEE